MGEDVDSAKSDERPHINGLIRAILNLVLILGKFFRSTCKKVVLIDRSKKPVWKAREGDTAND